MRKYSANLAFVDLLFNLLIGFTCLLVLAFLLINPVADDGKIDPQSEFIVTYQWDEDSPVDIDGWVKGPDDTIVGFRNKDGGWIILERDDLGRDNDWYVVNGVRKVLRRNIETISFNAKMTGEYTINVHNYSNKNRSLPEGEIYPTPVRIDIIKLNPFRIILTKEVYVRFKEEVTMATFVLDEKNKVVDIRTDIQVPLFYKFAGTSGLSAGETRENRPDSDNVVSDQETQNLFGDPDQHTPRIPNVFGVGGEFEGVRGGP